jgi:hypothetical protein
MASRLYANTADGNGRGAEIWFDGFKIRGDYTTPSLLVQNDDSTRLNADIDQSRDLHGTANTSKKMLDRLEEAFRGSEYEVVFFPYNVNPRKNYRCII